MDEKTCPHCNTVLEQVDIAAWECRACGHYQRSGELAGDIVEDLDAQRRAAGTNTPLPHYIVQHYELRLDDMRKRLHLQQRGTDDE